MKQKGINRIVVGVWDFEKGKQYFEKLLGAEFAPENQDGEAAAFGVRVAMAWESGIELVSPLPGVQSPVRDEMEKNGEGEEWNGEMRREEEKREEKSERQSN